MDPRKLAVDQRLTGQCVYCGARPESRDHVPSRVLLDEPFPDNVAVVDACDRCNQSFSLDEEYLACFVEWVLCGGTGEEAIQRPKIKRILADKPSLAKTLENSREILEEGSLLWKPDLDRVRNVVLKLARGHAAYELSLPHLDPPDRIGFAPFLSMTDSQREEFERAGAGELRGWPEIGSRAFLRAAGARPFSDQVGPWIEVQTNRYRYSVDQHGGTLVRMVLSEYLACEVEWE